MQATAPIIIKKKPSIKDWAQGDQPREKLLRKSPQALSDSELLAILIQSGTKESSAVEVAREILKSCKDNLNELGKYPISELTKIKGIGLAKAITISAALELGRRRQSVMSLKSPIVKDSKDVAGYIRPLLSDYAYEVFGVLYLSQSGEIKQFELMSQGGITGTVVDPRLIFKKALELTSVSLVACHNHPSGNLKPSKADIALTTKLNEGAKILDIKLLDHIIVAGNEYFSFADEGLLN